MPMTAKGIHKLVEECGELVQIASKKMAYFYTDEHPDGKGSMATRMRDEMGDVMAAIRFTAEKLEIDIDDILRRADHKYRVFRAWDADPSNNSDGVDRPPV